MFIEVSLPSPLGSVAVNLVDEVEKFFYRCLNLLAKMSPNFEALSLGSNACIIFSKFPL